MKQYSPGQTRSQIPGFWFPSWVPQIFPGFPNFLPYHSEPPVIHPLGQSSAQPLHMPARLRDLHPWGLLLTPIQLGFIQRRVQTLNQDCFMLLIPASAPTLVSYPA